MTWSVEECQSLVLSSHGRLIASAAVWWSVPEGSSSEGGRDALRELLARVNFGIPPGDREVAYQVAVSAAGLRHLGVDDESIAACGRAFGRGIATERLQRALGDQNENDPTQWGWSDEAGHLLVLVYARAESDLDERLLELDDIRRRAGLTEIHRIRTAVGPESREPFGFADGISGIRPEAPAGSPRREPPPNIVEVPAGEVILGQEDALGVQESFGWLGNGGSFLVARQLEQDVEGFWRFWIDESEDGDEEEAVWLASKAMGRWPNGMPASGDAPVPQPPVVQAEVEDGFRFAEDRFGDGCPIGSHVRRANPRDGLDPDKPEQSAESSRKHLLMRRGRRYGDPAPARWFPELLKSTPVARPPSEGGEEAGQDDTERGLLFIALMGDIARQFEFVQQTWLNNARFSTLSSGVDPISPGRDLRGNEGVFVVPRHPVRRRVHGLDKPWVTTRGGGYYLLPSRSALTRILGGS